MNAPNIVGLDLSITATGICDRDDCLLTVGGKAELGDHRIQLIVSSLEDVLTETIEAGKSTDLVVIEGLAAGQGGGNGLAAAQVMGAVKLHLLQHAVPYVLVPPASLKKYATGKGNCGKPEMAVALYKRTGLELADDNQVDAAWLRFMGLDALGHPAFDLPAAQRAALDKVDWDGLRLVISDRSGET